MTFDIVDADAVQKAQAYAGLAGLYVHSGDAFLALHAQLLADLALASRALHDAGLPDGNFLEAITQKMTAESEQLDKATPAEALLIIRDLVSASLPEGVNVVFGDTFNPLYELVEDAPPSSDVAQVMSQSRLVGLDPEDYVAGKYAEAQEHRAQARHGAVWDGVVSNYAADLAFFEGWIIEKAIESGDTLFVQAEIRWALAMATLETIKGLPEDATAAASMIHGRLAWVLGPDEAPAFLSALQTV
jgi:hypothetical protein